MLKPFESGADDAGATHNEDEKFGQLPSVTAQDILASGTIVEFCMADSRLTQTFEWIGGKYQRISWPSILPPDWTVDLPVTDAVTAISTLVRLPDFCLNA